MNSNEQNKLEYFQKISIRELSLVCEKENDQLNGDWISNNKDKWTYLLDMGAINEWNTGIYYVTKKGEDLITKYKNQ